MCCRSDGDQSTAVLEIKPYERRGCTDVLFLLLFLISWGGTIYITSQAIGAGGDPNRIIRGVDYAGRICGKDEGVKDQELAAWSNPLVFETKLCVASCTETRDSANIAEHHESEEFLFFCIPVANASIEVSTEFGSTTEMFSRAMGDLIVAQWVIAGSIAIAIVLSFFYLVFVRNFAGCMVWSVIFGILLGGAFLAWTFLENADEAEKSEVDDDRVDTLRAVGYGLLVGDIVFACLVLFMRQRIRIAVQVVKEASKAIASMKTIVFFPMFPFAFAIAYLSFWVIVGLYIYSVADKKTTTTDPDARAGVIGSTQVVYERDESFNNAIAYHFFCLLWNVQFLIYFGFMVIAGAVADWYFSGRAGNEGPVSSGGKRSGKVAPAGQGSGGGTSAPQQAWASDARNSVKPLSDHPITDSVKRTARYHVGTVAFGSLIIAIINFVRAVVYYIEEKTKDGSNSLQRCCLCIIQCCLSCMHWCADKISKNAFIWTAIYGDSFIPAAAGSFNLIWANLTRVAAVHMVGAYLMFLGKVLVAGLTTGICGLIFIRTAKFQDELSSPLMPCFVIFIIAYVIASMFMLVYDTTIDTIFLCFLVDCENNRGVGLLASKSLVDLVDNYKEKSLAKGESYKSIREGVVEKD